MWPRVVEVMIGAWLLMSPFIFGHGDTTMRWVSDYVSAALLISFALLSYVPRCRMAHLGSIAVGFWLCGYGYFGAPYPTPPALQNDLLVGLTVLMFAIIPSHAATPPPVWQEVIEKEHSA